MILQRAYPPRLQITVSTQSELGNLRRESRTMFPDLQRHPRKRSMRIRMRSHNHKPHISIPKEALSRGMMSRTRKIDRAMRALWRRRGICWRSSTLQECYDFVGGDAGYEGEMERFGGVAVAYYAYFNGGHCYCWYRRWGKELEMGLECLKSLAGTVHRWKCTPVRD